MTFDEAAILHQRIIALTAAMGPIQREVGAVSGAIKGDGDGDGELAQSLRSAWTPVIERLCDIALKADEVTDDQCAREAAKACPGQARETPALAFALSSVAGSA